MWNCVPNASFDTLQQIENDLKIQSQFSRVVRRKNRMKYTRAIHIHRPYDVTTTWLLSAFRRKMWKIASVPSSSLDTICSLSSSVECWAAKLHVNITCFCQQALRPLTFSLNASFHSTFKFIRILSAYFGRAFSRIKLLPENSWVKIFSWTVFPFEIHLFYKNLIQIRFKLIWLNSYFRIIFSHFETFDQFPPKFVQ